MKQTIWTPINPDGLVNEAELRRPGETATPTCWEVVVPADAPEDFVGALFGVAAWCPQHTFRLTCDSAGALFAWCNEGLARSSHIADKRRPDHHPMVLLALEYHADAPGMVGLRFKKDTLSDWPLPNVTLVSPVIRTQAEADRVLPALLGAKAARREAVFAPREMIDGRAWIKRHAVQETGDCASWCEACESRRRARLLPDAAFDAVRVRGGTGPKCIEPMSTAAVRSLRDQAKAAGVEFTLSWGRWVPIPDGDDGPNGHLFRHIDPDTWFAKSRTGGCALDAVEYPEVL